MPVKRSPILEKCTSEAHFFLAATADYPAGSEPGLGVRVATAPFVRAPESKTTAACPEEAENGAGTGTVGYR